MFHGFFSGITHVDDGSAHERLMFHVFWWITSMMGQRTIEIDVSYFFQESLRWWVSARDRFFMFFRNHFDEGSAHDRDRCFMFFFSSGIVSIKGRKIYNTRLTEIVEIGLLISLTKRTGDWLFPVFGGITSIKGRKIYHWTNRHCGNRFVCAMSLGSARAMGDWFINTNAFYRVFKAF